MMQRNVVAVTILTMFTICCFSNQALGYTNAISVTVDADNTPFVLDDTGAVWAYRYPDYLFGPIKLQNLKDVKQIVPFAALTKDGHVFTWDYGSLRACGSHDGFVSRDETYSEPKKVAGLSGVISISGLARHFLALRRDGTVVEFGRKLNVDYTTLDPCAGLPRRDLIESAFNILNVVNVVSIATDGNSDSVLNRNGFFLAWGKILLDHNWRQESRSENWVNNEKIFIGNDKVAIYTNGYLVALSRIKKAYYWGICANGVPPYGVNVLSGATNNLSNIKKISLSPNSGFPNAIILDDGSVAVSYPPDRTPGLGICVNTSNPLLAQPAIFTRAQVKFVDAAMTSGPSLGGTWLLMIGADGSLWKIKWSLSGQFSELTNLNLP